MNAFLVNKHSFQRGLFVAAAVSMFWTVGNAQEKRTAPRGRLPAHYKDLVSPDQREEIYEIQKGYNEKIAQLEAEIEKLKSERDQKVERVLTPAQVARLQLLKNAKGEGKGDGAAKTDAAAKAKQAAGEQEKKDVFPK